MIIGKVNLHSIGTDTNTMKPEKIEIKILTMVAIQIGAQPEEHITKSSDFDTLGFDSLDTLEFIMYLEEEFNIEVNEQDLIAKCDSFTIQDAADMIDKLITNK